MQRLIKIVTEIQDINEKLDTLKRHKDCILSLKKYNIPVNFGYNLKDNVLELYFHSIYEINKSKLIKYKDNAFFTMRRNTKLADSEKSCDCIYASKNIYGFGKVILMENENEKKYGLNLIIENQMENGNIYEVSYDQLEKEIVLKMNVEIFKVIKTEYFRKTIDLGEISILE